MVLDKPSDVPSKLMDNSKKTLLTNFGVTADFDHECLDDESGRNIKGKYGVKRSI